MAQPETPTGTPTGTTGSDGLATFTCAAAIVNELLTVDRLVQITGTDYTVSGSTITFLAPNIPLSGSVLRIWYGPGTPVTASATGVTTLLGIRTACVQRANMVTPSTTTFVTTSEWNAMINSSYQELYDLLVEAYGADYFLGGTPDSWYQFTTTSSTSYALPNGTGTYTLSGGGSAPAFYKLLGVDLKVGSDWISIKGFGFADRNRYSTRTGQSWPADIRYRLAGNYLWLTPTPASGQIFRLWYVPRCILLVNDADTLDGINGWEEYIISDVAAKALAKEESDPSAELARKGALLARIRDIAIERDASTPARVSDMRDGGEWDCEFR